uniref:Transcription initiation factor IIB n=1 Tax=Pithovirus LCPAC401 TaxID=2506595 RepID=A0A481Z9S4_9VIRU|nr:MAG: transcription initiation factor IIB [Pithovirus LCPAC401]
MGDEEHYCEGDNVYTKSEFSYITTKSRCSVDFDFIKIDDHIREQAKIICIKLTANMSSKRIARVKNLQFISIFFAYQKLGIPVQPLDIVDKFKDMTKQDMLTAFHSYNELETGYRPDNIDVTVENILKIYCDKLDINDMYENVVLVAERVFRKNASIKLKNMVQVTAGAVLLHFLRINGIKFENKEKLEIIVARLTHKSPETIKSLSKKIFIIDNS